MKTETLTDQKDDPAFKTSLETGVLYEAPLSEIWELATGSTYGNHYEPDDMAQYILVRAADGDQPGEELWMMDLQSVDRDSTRELRAASSQDEIIAITANRSTVPKEFVERCQHNHFYRKCLRIDRQELEKPFKRLADLHDWSYATEEEATELLESDPSSVITGVSLFCQHGWQWQTGKRGIAIKQKK